MDNRKGRLLRTVYGVIALCGLMAAGLALSVSGYGIPCVFHLLTGLLCPGCGITRMFLSLLQGDWAAAFHRNPAVFLMLPALVLLVLRIWIRWLKTGNMRIQAGENRGAWTMIIFLLIFGVWRNTPLYPF